MHDGSPRPAGLRVGAVGVVWLGGRDRLAYLDRLSTHRVRDLPRGGGRATAVLTDAGRVVDVVACYPGAEAALLITSAPESAPVVTAHLRRYVLYDDDVRVTDAGAQVAALRIVGPRARAVAEAAVAAFAGLPLGVEDAGAEAVPAWREIEGGPWPVWLLEHPSPGGLGGVDAIVPAGEAAERLAERLAAAGAVPLDTNGYDAVRIARCQPRFGAEIDGVANPLELGLRPLVDFGKGCYIGQEIVARLDSYERVQRRLVRLDAESPIAVGDRIGTADGGRRTAREGRVTTMVAEGGRWRALALAPQPPRGAGDGGERLVVATAQGPVAAWAAACDAEDPDA